MIATQLERMAFTVVIQSALTPDRIGPQLEGAISPILLLTLFLLLEVISKFALHFLHQVLFVELIQQQVLHLSLLHLVVRGNTEVPLRIHDDFLGHGEASTRLADRALLTEDHWTTLQILRALAGVHDRLQLIRAHPF
jgi:hypothetical protein